MKRSGFGCAEPWYLGMGQEVQMFENMLTDYFGQEATCVVNGTYAAQLALQAAGVVCNKY